MVQKNCARFKETVTLQPFAVESRGFHQMLRKDTVYQSMQNLYQLVKYFSTNSRNLMSDITLYVNMAHMTVKDRLLIKTSQIEKVWIVETNDC